MKTEDGQDFKKKMIEIFSLYQREISEISLRAWWRIFDEYSWRAIDAALDEHVKKSRFFPTPADIFAILEKNQVRETSVDERQYRGQHRALIATQQILEDLRSRSSNISTATRAIAAAKGSLKI